MSSRSHFWPLVPGTVLGMSCCLLNPVEHVGEEGTTPSLVFIPTLQMRAWDPETSGHGRDGRDSLQLV